MGGERIGTQHADELTHIVLLPIPRVQTLNLTHSLLFL